MGEGRQGRAQAGDPGPRPGPGPRRKVDVGSPPKTIYVLLRAIYFENGPSWV